MSTKGKAKSRALELTQEQAELLHEALEALIASGEVVHPRDKAELRVLSKRARELAK